MINVLSVLNTYIQGIKYLTPFSIWKIEQMLVLI